MLLTNDLGKLLTVLPIDIKNSLEKHPNKNELVEIVLDIGRRPEARFFDKTVYLSYRTIGWQDLDFTIKKIGKFSNDNRAGIEKTLHRISAIKNRTGNIIGLTCRIGRAVFGNINMIRDILDQHKSILILGKPGVGKTTIIREIARILADIQQKRVVIIDTSNEIAGDGDLPHPSIGKARRMQVSRTEDQHQTMIEAVENHMPEVIIIDEIGTVLEADAARTVAQRGIQLIGTTHGNTLANVLKNPTTTDLVGGIQYVTLGDEESKRRGSPKSVLERKASATFDIALEVQDSKTFIIHQNVEQSVDLLLQNKFPLLETRFFRPSDNYYVQSDFTNQPNYVGDRYSTAVTKALLKKSETKTRTKKSKKEKKLKISSKLTEMRMKTSQKILANRQSISLYSYGINSEIVRSLIKTLGLPITLVTEIELANTILGLTNVIKNNKNLKQFAQNNKIQIHAINTTSLVQIKKALTRIIQHDKKKKIDYFAQAKNTLIRKYITPIEEIHLLIENYVILKGMALELNSSVPEIQKLQQEIIQHYGLRSFFVGENQNKRIRIYPN